MQNRILVLNVDVSGMNKYLFAQLKRKGWGLDIIDVPFSKMYRWRALISTFRPNISHSQWKKRFEQRLGQLYKMPESFLRRSSYCQKKIEGLNGEVDIIFQVSGMFSPYINYNRVTKHKDYVLMLSYTMALSDKYSRWVPFASKINEWLKLERKLYKNAKMIFTTNDNARKSLIDDYGQQPNKIIKVGYGLNLNKFPEFSKTYDGKTILFIGMDFERKGGYVLLNAFKKVREIIPDARLIIAGPNKDIYRINEPGVRTLGYIKDKQRIVGLYKQASIFVMPSLCEPFGLVFLEAMAYKLPCIGTTIDAMPEIIEDGKTGYLVPANDIDSLTEKIITLLGNPAKLKTMGIEAYNGAKENFSWNMVGEKIDSGLRNVLVK
jgi:glycosyltransferase involved in cell wall biosynthesis